VPNKILIRQILLLLLGVLTVVAFFSIINFFILPSRAGFRVYDWFLFEGIFCIIVGILFALGRGGISPGSLKEARLRATVDAVYGTDYSVSEVYKKDKWKPKGFPKAATVLLIAGVVMLAVYLITS